MRHFIVLGRARVGSNLLISLLRQHPHVSARGEELAGKKDNLDEAIANVFRPNRPQAKASGVKLFYYHPAPYERALESVEWCEAWERAWSVVGQISGLHVIHLVRENPLRSLVSQKIAIVTGVWQVTPEKGSLLPLGQRKVAVDAGKFIRYVRDTEAWRHDFDRRFPERNLRVTYEDLVARPQEVMDGIFGFLGLETVALAPFTSQRQNPEPLSELIANYSELRVALSGTKLERYLDEEAERESMTGKGASS